MSQHAELLLLFVVEMGVAKVDVNVIGAVQRVHEAHAFRKQDAILERARQQDVLIGVAVSKAELHRRRDEIILVDIVIQSQCIPAEREIALCVGRLGG